jgi:hypothetical protein
MTLSGARGMEFYINNNNNNNNNVIISLSLSLTLSLSSTCFARFPLSNKLTALLSNNTNSCSFLPEETSNPEEEGETTTTTTRSQS